MALYSQSAVKVHLGISGTAEDTWLDAVGPRCEQALLSKLGLQVEQTTITQFLSGTGTNRLYLPVTPVQSITTIHVRSDLYFGDGDAPTSDDLLTAGTDYTLARDQEYTGSNIKSRTGLVYRIGDVWDRPRALREGLLASMPADSGMGNIKAVWVAGWSTVPADIYLALHQMIAVIRLNAQSGGSLSQESLDYWSGTFWNPVDMAKALGSVQDLIAPYRKLVLC